MKKEHRYEFDLFISYSRIPDGVLAKELERLLESFHKDLVLNKMKQSLRPLSICIDNSDFSIPPADVHILIYLNTDSGQVEQFKT